MTDIQIWTQIIPLNERARVVRAGGYENYTKEILERASFNELNDEEKKSHRWRYVTLVPSPEIEPPQTGRATLPGAGGGRHSQTMAGHRTQTQPHPQFRDARPSSHIR